MTALSSKLSSDWLSIYSVLLQYIVRTIAIVLGTRSKSSLLGMLTLPNFVTD